MVVFVSLGGRQLQCTNWVLPHLVLPYQNATTIGIQASVNSVGCGYFCTTCNTTQSFQSPHHVITQTHVNNVGMTDFA